jgi:hypothetical protein
LHIDVINGLRQRMLVEPLIYSRNAVGHYVILI